MTTRTVITYSDFSLGEYGSRGAWNAPNGSFTGLNVVQFLDGSVGPRSKAKKIPVTGMPTTGVGFFGVRSRGSTPRVFFSSSDRVYDFIVNRTTPQAVSLYGIALSAEGQPSDYVLDGGIAYVSNHGDRIYRFDGTVVTGFAGTPNGEVMEQFGERTVVSEDSLNGGRIRFSDPADPTSWPALNFFDLPTSDVVKMLVVQRNSLVIFAGGGGGTPPSSADCYWYVLTGVPGVSSTLRLVSRQPGPMYPSHWALLGDDRVLFVHPFTGSPAFFTGSGVTELDHLQVTSSWATVQEETRDFPNAIVLAGRRNNDWMMLSDVDTDPNFGALLSRRGVITRHQLTEFSGLDVLQGALARNLDMYVFAAVPDVGETEVWWWRPSLERPPFASDPYVDVMSPELCYFEMPEWWARDGEEVSVRKVIVAFRDWNTGGEDNQFDVVSTPLRQYERGEGDSKTQSFSRPAAESSVGGVNLRREFNFAASDFGNGFKVGIANMRGVAIQKIQVVLNHRPMQAI